MKKLMTFLLVATSLTSFAQSKPDTTAKPADTTKTYVLVGAEPEFNYLLTVLAQSKLQVQGEPLTFAQASELIRWVQAARLLAPADDKKEKPKKK